MSHTEIAHEHRQGGPHTHTAIQIVEGGIHTQHQLKLNMATMGAAILPLVHNTTQTHTSLEETEQRQSINLLDITSNATQLQHHTTEYC